MEILFENRYVRDKAFAKEFYRYYYFEKSSLITFYGVILLASILLAVFEKIYLWFVLVFVPVLFLFQFYRYFHQINIMLQQDKELAGGEVTVHMIATEDFIQNTASSGEIKRIHYDAIQYVKQTKNLILLRSKAESVFIFLKNSFEKGTEDEFVAFLKRKGVKEK